MAEDEHNVYPGTGRIQRLEMYPMSVRELTANASAPSILERLANEVDLPAPVDPPDLPGYLDLALASGFPVPALDLSGRARDIWLESYVENLLGHDLEALGGDGPGRRRDPLKVRAYFEACALNTAGIVDHRALYNRASISKVTGESYDRLLHRLMVVDQIPAWASNRLKRLVGLPKRYLIDASLVAATLRLDAAGILADGDLLGRILDTFVASQLRPEVGVSSLRPRLYHLRTKQGRQEIDLLVELPGKRLIGFEIKATAAPTRTDGRHLAWLRDQVGDRFVAGVVFHTGPRTFQLEERIHAAPIATLWS